VAVVWLINTTRGPVAAALLRPADAVVWTALALGLAGTILVELAWAFVPVTVVLVSSALLVLSGINYAVIGLTAQPEAGSAEHRSWHGGRLRPSAWPALALLLAAVEAGGLALARWGLMNLVGQGAWL
jgi:CBS-domain-containing membrane protein